MQISKGFALVIEDPDIVTLDPLGRPETHGGVGVQPVLIHNFLQHCLGIGIELPGLFTHHRVFKNRRKLAVQVPGDEKGRPVDGLQ